MKKFKLLVFPVTLLLLVGCGNTYTKLESELKDKASKFYEDNIKDKVLFAGAQKNVQQKVTLTAMEKSKVDIKDFNDAKCDKDASYALIIYATDKDGKQKGDYKVENHLKCDDYKTEKK